ncbi:uncharacterized protein LOC129726526 [Wyeomyia smithii]|uniref:uncharacterized protein LOC129726526 n=1 Tax=Wyeomyia smithii TaxID=174621 RepID=UPI00246802CD|nr:uncharacterized protein LOC129726526 [Wyeomyia smithii]
MMQFTSVGCGLVLLANRIHGYNPLLVEHDYSEENFGSEELGFDLAHEHDHHHYHYHQTPPPPRVKIVKQFIPARPPSSPLAIQKVDLTKNSLASSGSGLSHTLTAIVLALTGQLIGTLAFLVVTKLLLGIKAILVTNTVSLGLILWKHLKKMKRKKHRKMHGHKAQKQKKKKHKKKCSTWKFAADSMTKKQIKQLLKLMEKRQDKSEWF